MNKGVIFMFICLFLPVTSAEKNWLEIAKKTDVPAIGAEVRKVESGSEAEEKGLKAGEVICLLNDAYFGFGREIPSGEFKIEVYSPITEKKRVIELSVRGLDGVKRDDFSYPWVSYLRGEIGVRGEWDQKLVNFMVNLFQVGSVKEGSWKAILKQGYPVEDKLYDLIELTIQWQSGQYINTNEYLSQWGENPIPDTVFNLLEQMAFSSNDGKLLKELAMRSPEKLRMSSNDLSSWLKMTEGVSNARNGHKLLEYVKSVRTRRVENEFEYMSPSGETRSLTPGVVTEVEAGRYRLIYINPPEDYQKRELHYKVKFSVVGFATTRWASAVRIGAYRVGEGWKNLGNIMVSQSNKGETIVEARGFDIGYGLSTRNHPQFPKRKAHGLKKKKERAPEMTLDLVLLNDECAVFMNGQSLGHWKITPSDDPIALTYFVCGAISELKDIEIWELDSSPD